ncbi:MAG: chorismate mutase [Spirochaetota bacterium]
MKHYSIEKLRRRIDRIDRRLVRVLLLRYAAVREMGMVKKRKGLKVVDREREKSILKNIAERVKNPSACNFITAIYRTIFRASRTAEEHKPFNGSGVL